MTNSHLSAALADHPFFSSLPPETLRRLAVHAQRYDFPAGHQIFAEGEDADRFFLIRRGGVRLDIEIPGRGAVEVERLGPDAALGWSWLFAPYRWQMTATTTARTTVIVFDAAVLRSLMATEPAIGYELMRRFAAVILDRLQHTRRRLDPDAIVTSSGAVGPWAGRDCEGVTAPH